MAPGDRLIWIDLEMTGLVPERDRIIEIATVVTDADLAVIAEGPVIAVRQPEATLASMDEWNTRTHGASGLVARVLASTTDEAAAERATLEFLARHVAPAQKRVLIQIAERAVRGLDVGGQPRGIHHPCTVAPIGRRWTISASRSASASRRLSTFSASPATSMARSRNVR